MICFPLDDTEYTAEALGAACATRTRGVYSGEGHFEVRAAGGMTVRVLPGVAWLLKEAMWGITVCEKTETSLSLDPGHSALHRIDAVCLRLDKNENIAEIVVKKGEESLDPDAPVPVRDYNYDEVFLALIRVPAGLLEITASYITDTRLDEFYCGLMRDGVTGLPSQGFQNQARDMLADIAAELESLHESSEMMLKSEYAPDAAAVVQGGRLVVTSAFPKAGTSYNVAFDAPTLYDPAVGVTIDGVAMQSVCGFDGKALQSSAWVQGAPVVLSRRGSKAFFKQGGAAFGLKATSGPTKPANPEENMIWVSSTIDAGPDDLKVYYGFSAPAPADLANGDVFILCGQGNIEVKSPDGRMGLCPIAVVQKQAGALQPRFALIWRGGAWQSFYSTTSLFNYSPLANQVLANSIDGISPSYGGTMQFMPDETAGYVPTGIANASSYLLFNLAPYVLHCKGKTVVVAVKPTAQNSNAKCVVGSGASTSNQGFLLNLVDNKLRVNYWNGPEALSQNTLTLNAWNVIALVQNPAAETAQLFVNGVPDSKISSVPNGNSTSKLCYGNRPAGASADYAFVGRMSQFYWYCRNLSEMEVCGLSLAVLNKVKGVY